MNTLPPLPKIEGDLDLVLDVYTHRSLRFGSAPMNDDYGDTDRLAELGSRILDLAVTFHYYSKKPMLGAAQIAEKRAQAISDENLKSWLESYGLKNKLRTSPGERDSIDRPEEIRHFFNTYIGALHLRNGMPTIQEWITRLIDPNAEPTIVPPSVLQDFGQQGWAQPMPPAGAPPPLPAYTPNNLPNSVNLSPVITLAIVNQTATQRGVSVTYPAEQSGPPHQPLWVVRCCMDGLEQGRGSGKSQKLAKEEAARQAWVNMGWGGDMRTNP